MKRWQEALLAAVIVGLLTACGPMSPAGSAPAAGPPMTVVTLGIYSGRLDPSWTLTLAEAMTLDTMLGALVEVTDTPPVGGLGYHGFTITRPSGTLVAYRLAIARAGEGPRIVGLDPTGNIERFLLETSRRHVTPDEYAAAEAAIGKP